MSKTLIGIVSSNKGNKTIVVTVAGSKTHPLYKKKYVTSKHFTAHDENNEAQVGDKVSIVESRPLSATKRFKLDKIIEKPIIREEQSVETVTAEPAPLEEPKQKAKVKK